MNNNILDFYLEDTVPQGFKEHLEPLFFSSQTDIKDVFNSARKFLELLLHHLSVISDIELREVTAIIEKLTSLRVIDNEVRPYFHFWWAIASLGSHFQPKTDRFLSWDQHLNLCRHAIGVCVLWYLHKYPPLIRGNKEREAWLYDVSQIIAVAYNDIQVCCQAEIDKHLEEKNVIVLRGRPWVGKTSIGGRITKDLVAKGYIPIVIHENSLVTSKILSYYDQSDNRSNSLRLASNPQVIHEIVSARLLHGDSFVLFLDDLFGHRRFQLQNPLTYLRIQGWLSLSALPQFLGKIKIVITTPQEFVIQARNALQENAKINPIAKDNLSILDDQNYFLLDTDLYTQNQLVSIVESASKFHGCMWSSQKHCCEIVAEIIKKNRLGFDVLHILCRDLKAMSDDEFLDHVVKMTAAATNINNALQYASLETKFQLCAAYVGEALIELYREFAFQTKLTFDDICQAISTDIPLDQLLVLSNQASEWLVADRVSTIYLSGFPVFTHPEIRYAVAFMVEKTMSSTIRDVVIKLAGLSDEYKGIKLSQWEAIHLLCRMAMFLDEKEAEELNKQLFLKRLISGGDPRNVFWAILGNWSYIRGTRVETHAMGYLKGLPNTLKKWIRPFIWEVVGNWINLSDHIRLIVLAQTGQKSKDESQPMSPAINDEYTLSFLAAGVVHYGAIQQCARSGCEASELYLDFMNIFISQIAKQGKSYTSRKDDRLFEAPGSKFFANAILSKLLELGLNCGSLSKDHPLAAQLKSALLSSQ